MADYDYDLIVLGAGSGGLATAKRAASHGARVAIVEDDRVGGTCVIRGCIPKKLMVYAGHFGHTFADAAGYGWSAGEPTLDWTALVASRDDAVRRLEATHERLLAEAGVELLRGHGRVTGEQTVDVGGRPVSGQRLLIATGAAPVLPELEGIEHCITSDGFFEMKQKPERAIIVGGGYIACEFAGILNALGVETVQFIRRDLPLRGFDEDLRRELLEAMRSAGVDVRTESKVERIRSAGQGLVVEAVGPQGSYELSGDAALVYAVGRRPKTSGLGLEEIGVGLDRGGAVACDENGRTDVASIFAVGDVTGRAALTPVAIQAGRALAERLYAGSSATMSYEGIPSAVFTDPPIGSVGLTEEQAVQRCGVDGVQTFRSRFQPLLHMLTDRKVATFVKLIVDSRDDRVLGCHIIGHDAGEIIQGFAVAMKAGATKADFDATVGIHPSTAEEFVTM